LQKKREREWFETGQPDYQRITNRLEVGIWWDGYIKKIYKADQTNVHKLGFVNMKSGAACVQCRQAGPVSKKKSGAALFVA
jgi:hypothetical protein